MSEHDQTGLPEGVEVRRLSPMDEARGRFVKILMAQHLEQCPRFGEIYVTTATAGGVRGGHVHWKTHEWFCVLDGEMTLWLRAVRGEAGDIHTLQLDGQRPAVVRVPPGVAHAFENAGERTATLLAYADRPYDPHDDDTVPCDLPPAGR